MGGEGEQIPGERSQETNTAPKSNRIWKFVAGTLFTLTLGAAIIVAPADSGATAVSVNHLERGDSASVVAFRMAVETPDQDLSAHLHPRIGFTAE